MLDKIKQYRKDHQLEHWLSLRGLGVGVFMVLLLLVSWSGVKVINSNYELQKHISDLQQQNDVSELENNNLKLKNEYLNTDQYLELSARAHFNKAAPGEKLIIVPESVALVHSHEIPEAKPKETVQSKQPTYEKNFNDWLNFFLHRS